MLGTVMPGLTAQTKVSETVWPLPSLTDTVVVNVPTALNVPEMTPVLELIPRLAGRFVALKESVSLSGSFAVTDKLIVCPMVFDRS